MVTLPNLIGSWREGQTPGWGNEKSGVDVCNAGPSSHALVASDLYQPGGRLSVKIRAGHEVEALGAAVLGAAVLAAAVVQA